jgi:hypothetical protein
MPLARGYGRSSIGTNIKREMKAGRPRSQAIAIALDHARREAQRRGRHPRALFGTPSAKRYLRKKRRASHGKRR